MGTITHNGGKWRLVILIIETQFSIQYIIKSHKCSKLQFSINLQILTVNIQFTKKEKLPFFKSTLLLFIRRNAPNTCKRVSNK